MCCRTAGAKQHADTRYCVFITTSLQWLTSVAGFVPVSALKGFHTQPADTKLCSMVPKEDASCHQCCDQPGNGQPTNLQARIRNEKIYCVGSGISVPWGNGIVHNDNEGGHGSLQEKGMTLYPCILVSLHPCMFPHGL